MPRKKKLKTLPNNVTEEEFLAVLNNITRRLASKFRFGYHDIDDMKQQAAIFAMEGLEKYDRSRPLENFLWTHVRNRLFNYKRNNYQRPDKPCLSCPLYDPNFKKSTNGCSKFANKNDCEPYNSWSKRNESKKNIMIPQNIENINENNSSHKTDDPTNFVGNQEIVNYLDENITKPEYREIYLKLKNGSKVNAILLNKLKKHIKQLLEERNDNL